MGELALEKVAKNFGGLKAVDSLDMTLRKGEILGLIGPNGAGKTTVFNLITGVYTPNNGEITSGIKNSTAFIPMKSSPTVSPGPFRTPASSRP
jgi:branched-chain amino acid transport system ATP-binding protein